MNNKSLIFLLLGLILLVSSCSKTKYKGFRQYTTNFFSYYNTYFNIKHRYRVGYREATQYKQENLQDILSVFEFENDPQYFEGISKFKETNIKVNKLLVMRPNSKWMDDAILVEGKGRYLRGDIDSALLLLQYVVDYYPKGYVAGHLPGGKLKGYDEKLREAIRKSKPLKQSPFQYIFARNEAQIWLVKALVKKGQYDRAQVVINQADADMGFPDKYRKDLAKAQIMLNIYQKNYSKAKENLVKLLDEHKMGKKEKGRMNFILAQIYEKENSLDIAKNHYEFALKNRLPDDLEFEATLRVLSMTESSTDEGLRQLKRMQNKGKYSSNLDKIYLAMGNIYVYQKQDSVAMVYYRKAIENSKNPNLKFIIFEKIGSIYYAKPNYLMAARYYDSAKTVMPANYALKKEFEKKAAALTKLLGFYNTYIQNDSILSLTSLGQERAKEEIERSLKKEYENFKKTEAEQQAQLLASESVKSNSLAQAGKWYFANKESVDKGRLSFQKNWGKFSLQDNWKKSNSNNFDIAKPINTEETKIDFNDENSIALVAEIEAGKLPYSESAQKPFVTDIQNALVQMARIYNYEILDFSKAIESYEILFSKYSKNISSEDEIMYALYRLYLEVDNIPKADSVKSVLLSKYPNSKYSLYATNPNAKSEDEKSDIAVARLYKDAYREYRIANYTVALGKCENIEAQYPKHALIPKVKLLKAFIFSYTNQSEIYIQTLESIVEKYSSSDEAKVAKEYLELIKKMQSAPKSTESQKEQEVDLPTKVPKGLEGVIKNNEVKEDKAPMSSMPVEEKNQEQPPKKEIASPQDTKSTTNPHEKEDELNVINYKFESNSSHVILYHLGSGLASSRAKNLLEVFLKSKGNPRLKVETLDIEKEQFVLISKFSNLATAKDFEDKNIGDILLQPLISNSSRYYITNDNLDILYISLGWKQYISFYQKNYR